MKAALITALFFVVACGDDDLGGPDSAVFDAGAVSDGAVSDVVMADVPGGRMRLAARTGRSLMRA